MTEIAILTPDAADPSYAREWPVVLERLQTALARGGITAVASAWTDHVESGAGLKAYPLILPVIAWGYHRDAARWTRATQTWASENLPVANPPSVLSWNTDKAYLGRLADRGVPLAPTLWVRDVTPAEVEAAFATLGTDQLVVKPTVSAGAWKTLRLRQGEPIDTEALPTGAAMIQPYLSTIETEGETSLLFFGGRFSHAVNKTPVNGDFRIQVQFGGQYRTVTPPEAAMALARQVLDTIEEPLLYARIDMAPDADGQWLLMEAELIEPDFYLKNDPTAGAGFVEAVRERLEA